MEASLSHEVTTEDGVKISFALYPGKDPQAALIICPGFFQSKQTPTFQRLAEGLSTEWEVVVMDFRGHGGSSGLYTFSAQESSDLKAVLSWARPRYPKLILLGFSLGGAVAINVLSHGSAQIHGLIAVSTPSLFEEIEFQFWTPEALRTGLQGWEPGAGCRPGNPWLSKERPIDRIRKVLGIPTIFVHGTKDASISFQHSQRLFEAASEPKELKIIEEGGHAEALFRDQPEQFLDLVKSWAHRTL